MGILMKIIYIALELYIILLIIGTPFYIVDSIIKYIKSEKYEHNYPEYKEKRIIHKAPPDKGYSLAVVANEYYPNIFQMHILDKWNITKSITQYEIESYLKQKGNSVNRVCEYYGYFIAKDKDGTLYLLNNKLQRISRLIYSYYSFNYMEDGYIIVGKKDQVPKVNRVPTRHIQGTSKYNRVPNGYIQELNNHNSVSDNTQTSESNTNSTIMKYGIINRHLKTVIPANYISIIYLGRNMFKAEYSSTYKVIIFLSEDNNHVKEKRYYYDFNYSEPSYYRKRRYFKCYKYISEGKYLYGYYNEKFNLIINPEYEELGDIDWFGNIYYIKNGKSGTLTINTK